MAEKMPKSLNYRMPPEWHPHAATLLCWPSNRETWPDERLERVEKVYLDIIDALHSYEPIVLLVNDTEVYKRVETFLNDRKIERSRITIIEQPTNDVWVRDCGPIFVRKQRGEQDEFAITDWEYNAWGGKYPPYDDDDRLPAFFAGRYGIQIFSTNMILEGGSIDTNGSGVLLTTESVLLNSNRNPDFSKQQIEQKLCDYLGVEKVIWLKDGLAGDDTDGHIDDIARFLNEDTILIMTVEDPEDINYRTLKTNLEILRESTDQHGNAFNIETLPLPETRIEGTTVDGSAYVPASYANYYVANGVVLLPVYDERYDRRALSLFESYFPDREVIGIPCTDLVWGQGSIHCITQQLYGIRYSPDD